MRVLVVDHNAIDPLGQRIYEELQKTGEFELRVVIPRKWHDTYRDVTGVNRKGQGGIEFVPVPVLFKSRTHRMMYRSLGAHIRAFAPDVLFLNIEPENFASWQACRSLRRLRSVGFAVTSWRNIDFQEEPFPYRAALLHRLIERTTRKRADGCVAFTAVTRTILEKAGYRHVVTISPHVDTDLFTPGTARPDRPFTVGYVGRLHAQKGVDLLLEAFASLPPGMRLVIVGNGPDEARLRRLSRDAGTDGRVEWRGAMSHGRLPEQYRDMDALVLPSRTGPWWKEQFGRVLIEAMSSGVPVIGSNSAGIPTVIGQAGLLFQEGDVRSLASCISRLDGDAAFRASQAVKGRDRAVTLFSVPVAVEAYASFLRTMDAERGHTPD